MTYNFTNYIVATVYQGLRRAGDYYLTVNYTKFTGYLKRVMVA